MRPQSAGAERPKSAAAANASSRNDYSQGFSSGAHQHHQSSSNRNGAGSGRDVFLRDGSGPSAQEAAKYAYDQRYRRPKTASQTRDSSGHGGGGGDGGGGNVDRSRAWGSHARVEPPHGGMARRDRPASAGAAAVRTTNQSGGGDDGAHVVAGARSMMGLARARSMKTSSTGASAARSSHG